MCGIFGYIGPQNPITVTLEGLKKLAYRGYDSAGIAGINGEQISFCKEVGKLSVLENAIKQQHLSLELAIGQTRWATHGKPSKVNAHPHFDTAHTLALVHNGIIENHEALRKSLSENGVHFVSQTDSEVIAHLIASVYEGDILKAVRTVIPLLKGAFAVALIHRDFPGQIIAWVQECPLIIGIGDSEAFIASDSAAFSAHTREVIFLENGEIAVIQASKVEVYNSLHMPVTKQAAQLSSSLTEISKEGFEHYTLKEIYEQPQTIRSALLSRFMDEYGTAAFEEFNSNPSELLSVERILLLGCGTSWNAAYIAAYMFEEKARIPAQAEISSEFRYKNPVVSPGTLVVAISQSGETADTIAAVRELKAKGCRIFAICNVHESTLSREADTTFFLKAGPEIGVCSTKAFTSQLVVLSLFVLMMARMRHLNKSEGQEFLSALKKLPDQVEHILNNSLSIQRVAQKYARYDNFFFLGRRYMYPASLEGALKLKEISYINANGYPAGEMKHGPIALINEECPTVALCANKATFEKLLSNLMEVKARSGPIIAIVEKGQREIEKIADDILWIPSVIDELAPILTTIITQLFAYFIALERGTDIDQPRNLAKSVTVE